MAEHVGQVADLHHTAEGTATQDPLLQIADDRLAGHQELVHEDVPRADGDPAGGGQGLQAPLVLGTDLQVVVDDGELAVEQEVARRRCRAPSGRAGRRPGAPASAGRSGTGRTTPGPSGCGGRRRRGAAPRCVRVRRSRARGSRTRPRRPAARSPAARRRPSSASVPRPTRSAYSAAPRSWSSPSAWCLAVAWSSLSCPALVASLALASPTSAWALTLSMNPMTPPRVVLDDVGLRLGRVLPAVGRPRCTVRPTPLTRSPPCAPGVTTWNPTTPWSPKPDRKPRTWSVPARCSMTGDGGGPTTPPPRCGTRAARWWTAGEFDEATRRAAGRLSGAGLRPGDRVVWSTDPSVDALVAHVGALRAGLVVVPANTAYSERELAHIVTDVRAAAAVVSRPEQADWVRQTSTGPIVVTGPGIDLPDADPGPARRGRSGRPGAHLLHLGHDRGAQGGGAPPPTPAGRCRFGHPGLAHDTRGPAGALPPDLPRPRPGGRGLRHHVGRGVGSAAARLRPRRGGRRRAGPPGVLVLRGADHVPPTGGIGPGRRAGLPPTVRVGFRPVADRAARALPRRLSAVPSSSATA